MTDQQLLELAAGFGFDHVEMLNVSALEFNPAVRDMCAADRCHSYGKCWTCPPHCGTLEEFAAKASTYHRGIIVQSTGQMEDDYDFETMVDTETLQHERFRDFTAKVREVYPNCMPLSAGACRICKQCACPDKPCRFPELAIPSMEASGLNVSKTCEDSGIGYYYGPKTITFTCCILTD